MEEFWKVITLSSPFPPPPANAVGFRTTTLQEFLPLSTEYGGGASNCHPATDLFVTSNAPAFVSSDAVNCAAIPPPPLPSRRLHPVSRKRGGAGSDADRRYEQRLIKNRESAERSRAKKQAYREELEIKVEHLKKENAELKRQKQLNVVRVPPVVPPQKKKLSRSLTL